MAAERTVDAYVAALPDGQREIAEAVRRLVRSTTFVSWLSTLTVKTTRR
jgi:hypothetical protein